MKESIWSLGATLVNVFESCLTDSIFDTIRSTTMKFFNGKTAVAAVAALAILPNSTLGITPEQLLAAPRRGAAVPNPSGVRLDRTGCVAVQQSC